jgi:hypothetical protein
MVNNRRYILHIIGYKKGKRHDYDIYKTDHPSTPKEVINVLELAYRHRNGVPRTMVSTIM